MTYILSPSDEKLLYGLKIRIDPEDRPRSRECGALEFDWRHRESARLENCEWRDWVVCVVVWTMAVCVFAGLAMIWFVGAR